MRKNVLPVLVSYRNPHWIRVAIRSFHEHFPELPILIVDNNPRAGEPFYEEAFDAERSWLDSMPFVIYKQNHGSYKAYHLQTFPGRTHGSGLDLAMRFCRYHGYKKMLVIEPDCLTRGRLWLEEMTQAMYQHDYWLVGRNNLPFGAIHPCPSLWQVSDRWYGFEPQPIAPDRLHPRFGMLANLDHVALQEREVWDVGLKNWFLAAINNKAACLGVSQDFFHYWGGSPRPHTTPAPITIDSRLLEFPELRSYIPEFVPAAGLTDSAS